MIQKHSIDIHGNKAVLVGVSMLCVVEGSPLVVEVAVVMTMEVEIAWSMAKISAVKAGIAQAICYCRLKIGMLCAKCT